jgi:exosortase
MKLDAPNPAGVAAPAIPAGEASVLSVSPRAAWIAAVAWAALFVATFWDFFRAQVGMATSQVQDWGHTLLIPLIAWYFAYVNRARLTVQPFLPSFAALALVIAGVVVYSAAAFGPPALQHHNIRGLGTGIALLGCLLTVFGTRSFRYLWFPWAYWLVFGQYISDRFLSKVTERLQDWSAVGAHLLLNVLGLDTDRVGNVLTVHFSDGTSHPLNVAEACSGMRTLMAFLAIGVAMAALGLPRWWQRAMLVAAGIPISLFVNVLRVASLGLLSVVDPNFSTGEFHSMVGLVWLVPAFLMFLGAMWVIRNLVVDEVPAQGGGPR